MSTSTTISGLHCDVWQPQEDFAETDHCSSRQPPEFFIDLFVCTYATQGDEIVSTVRYKNFRRRCEDTFSWSAISSMLSEANIPYHLQPFFIQQISARARGIAGEPNNALCRTIPMVVELRMPEETAEETADEFDYEAEAQMSSGLTRASGLSIQEMEKVEVDGFSSNCVICLDEIAAGSDAVRMPCLHFYHQNCILRWLQNSNLCPLCRFQMPMEED